MWSSLNINRLPVCFQSFIAHPFTPLSPHLSLYCCPQWAVLALRCSFWIWQGSHNGASGLVAVCGGPGSDQLSFGLVPLNPLSKGKENTFSWAIDPTGHHSMLVCVPRNAIIEVDGGAGHLGAKPLLCYSTPSKLYVTVFLGSPHLQTWVYLSLTSVSACKCTYIFYVSVIFLLMKVHLKLSQELFKKETYWATVLSVSMKFSMALQLKPLKAALT